jgi:WD40 repeat protein
VLIGAIRGYSFSLLRVIRGCSSVVPGEYKGDHNPGADEMAESTVDRPWERGRPKHSLRSGFAIVGFILCISASGQPASGQPAQWKQRIERPSRGWDYDGSRILGHIDYDICLWDATTGKLLHKMKGHKERIVAVQFSPDGHHALSSSWIGSGGMQMLISRDTRIILWNLETGRERDSFQGQVAGEFSPDGRRIVTFTQRPGTGKANAAWGKATLPSTGEVWQRGPEAKFDAAIWETYTGRQLAKAKLGEHNGPYWDTLHFSPDGRSFVHFKNGAFLLYNTSEGVLYNTSDGREIGRAALKDGAHRYTSNGALASFESKERIRLIDIKSGRTIQSVEHDRKTYWGGAWTHDGSKVVAIPSDESAIKIWDVKSGKMTTGAKNGPYPQKTAIISPDNNRLAIEWGGANHVEPGLGIYDMNTGEEIARIKLAKWGHMLGFSPDSKTLLVGGSEFVIYSSADGKTIRTLNLLDEVSFSHDWNH